MWILLNSDCVHFFTFLIDLRTSDVSVDGYSSFSIFKFTDDETHHLIDRLARLSKDRIYKV